MTEPSVNIRIVEMLEKYNTDIKNLAIKAVQLSESFPEATVAEQLQTLIRDAAKNRGQS